MIKENKKDPEQAARGLVHKLNISSPPINVFDVCSSLNIDITYKAFDDVDACFILKNGSKKIIVNNFIRYPTREKFTIAHELGHYFLPKHRKIYLCSPDDIQNFESNKKHENEANEFAAEFLMPNYLFKLDVEKMPLSMETLKELSNKYETSLTSTAIKYIKTINAPVALFFSDRNNIRWAIKSDSFMYDLRDGWLSEKSYAHNYFEGFNLPSQFNEVSPEVWIRSPMVFDDFFESSYAYSSLNKVLTLVTIKDFI